MTLQPGYGQSSLNAIQSDCPEVIMKDSTTFVFIDWIRKEIPKDRLIVHCEKAFDELWGTPDGDGQNGPTDSLATHFAHAQRKQFLNEITDLQHKLTKDDRVYAYSSSISDWNTLTGEVGIAVLRGCVLIHLVVMARS